MTELHYESHAKPSHAHTTRTSATEVTIIWTKWLGIFVRRTYIEIGHKIDHLVKLLESINQCWKLERSTSAYEYANDIFSYFPGRVIFTSDWRC